MASQALHLAQLNLYSGLRVDRRPMPKDKDDQAEVHAARARGAGARGRGDCARGVRWVGLGLG